MSANTKIEWADHTFNPWTGCTKVSPACDHCYAEGWAKRSGHVEWGPGAIRRRTTEANWRQPLKWNAEAARLGIRYRVFCASLADVFDNQVPSSWRSDLLDLIDATPNLDWLLLTKRIGNVAKMLHEVGPRTIQHGAAFEVRTSLPQNVWLGATICNQEEADRDIPKLLAAPAAKRFLSIEPMLGPVDLRNLNKDRETHEIDCLLPDKWEQEVESWRGTSDTWEEDFFDWYGMRPEGASGPMHAGIDWVIVGGESGPGARPMHPDWARSLRDQCQAAGVPFLFKQWGEWLPWHHFQDADIKDGDPDQPTKFTTLEWNGHQWNDAGKPDYWDTLDGAIDDEQCVGRVGKKAAGRLLDGREWNEVPSHE